MFMGTILRVALKVTIKGAITIPKTLRNDFGVKPGDIIFFVTDNGKIILRKGPIKI
jgi:AbrB family looped-hinge helix DNA binding protein